MKIFRDDTYGRLGYVFAADCKLYGPLGIFKTFPQAEFNSTLMNTFAAPIINLPPIRKHFDKSIKKMVEPHKKVVANA